MSVFADVGRRLSAALDRVIDSRLMSDWSEAGNKLYKEQFEMKANPYGEPWEPRPGDDKRKQSRYFGKVLAVGNDHYSVRVAHSNARRSCVPFEPRGLGRWRPTFEDILSKKIASTLRGI